MDQIDLAHLEALLSERNYETSERARLGVKPTPDEELLFEAYCAVSSLVPDRPIDY